jgi:uncharacterized protein with beta-barrel porin domain
MSLLLNGFIGGRSEGGFGPAMGYAPEPSLPPGAADAFASFDRRPQADLWGRWNAWSSAYGGVANARGDATTGSNDTRSTAFGFAAGIDRRISPDLVAGFALAGGSTRWSVANGFGSGRGEAFQVGGYASRQFGAAYLSAAAAYSAHWMSTDRTVTVNGTDNLTASFTAHNVGARIEAGHRFVAPMRVAVTPYTAVQVQTFWLPSYGETATSGSNQFALSYNSRTATTTRAELGAWFDTKNLFPSRATNLFARLAWAHDWRSDASVTAGFQTLAGTSFVVNGAAPPKNLALVTAGATVGIARNVSFTAKFDGEFASGFQSFAGTGTLKYMFD